MALHAQAIDGVRGVLEGIRSYFAQDGFELGKKLFNGIEVGAVCWKVNRSCAASFDGFFDSSCLVNTGVVHE